MKLTEQEQKFIKSLNNTEIGKEISSYAEHVIGFICDSRNWSKDDTKESVNKASEVIQRFFIDKIRLQNKSKQDSIYQME